MAWKTIQESKNQVFHFFQLSFFQTDSTLHRLFLQLLGDEKIRLFLGC